MRIICISILGIFFTITIITLWILLKKEKELIIVPIYYTIVMILLFILMLLYFFRDWINKNNF